MTFVQSLIFLGVLGTSVIVTVAFPHLVLLMMVIQFGVLWFLLRGDI